jgi:hypothetical protein
MSKTAHVAFAPIEPRDGMWQDHAPPRTLFKGEDGWVILADHEDALLRWLAHFPAVVGCVAWLTNYRILCALAPKTFCSIVMQKEDWLRPDYDGQHPARQNPSLYLGENTLTRYDFSGLSGLSFATSPQLDRFRVLGFADPKNRPVMHHKFLVGGRLREPSQRGGEDIVDSFIPQSVWAGSWNMTRGSTRNLDSAIVLGAGVARVYYQEWLDVIAHSEPLNFQARYSEPEWRVGS